MAIPLIFSDFEYARFTPERQFHVLKHLSAIDGDYKESLIHAYHCSDRDIQEQMRQKGSKFYRSFCDNPEELLDILKEEFNRQNIEAYWHNGRCKFQLDFSKDEFPGGIGDDRVIHLNQVPDQVPDMIKKPFNDKDFETLQAIIYKTDPKTTWTSNIILESSEGKALIIAIFPGIYAPAFPNWNDQTDEQYQNSMDFWCQHIIIS